MPSTDPAETARWMVLAFPPVEGLADEFAGVGPVATEASAKRLQAHLELGGWQPTKPLRYFSAAEAREMIVQARKEASDGK